MGGGDWQPNDYWRAGGAGSEHEPAVQPVLDAAQLDTMGIAVLKMYGGPS